MTNPSAMTTKDITTAGGITAEQIVSILIDAWENIGAKSVPAGVKVIMTRTYSAGMVNAGVLCSGARYVEDPDQVTATASSFRRKTANGVWFILDDPAPNLAQFGIIGTADQASAQSDETDAIEAAFAFCSTAQRTLFVPARYYWARSVLLRSGLKLASNGGWFGALPGYTDPFVTMTAGRNRYLTIDGVGFQGAGTANQMGLYLDARRGSTGDGGLWDSRVVAKVRGFASHNVWLRGGNSRGTGSPYDYTCPIQFNTFSLDVERPSGNISGCALVMTGQCGQNYFIGQNRFDSRKTAEAAAGGVKGLNVYAGREFAGGVLPGVPYDPASGATLGVVSGAPVDDIAPDTVTMKVTSQQAERALWFDRGVFVVEEGSYLEDLQRAIKLTGTATLKCDGAKFGNAGSDGAAGGYHLEYGAGCSVFGRGNYSIGTRDKHIVRPAAALGRNIDVESFFTNFSSSPDGFTSGISVDISVANTGELTTLGYHALLVYGSTVEVAKITSYLLAGSRITLRCHSNYLIFAKASGTNFAVPNDRVILRAGDGITFEVMDVGVRLQCVGIARAELRAAAMPTAGYYEIGEFVRTTGTAKPYGAFTLGWRRLTTGSNHALDVDWRVEISNERFQRVLSVGTAATAIMSTAKGNAAYGYDRIDITIVGVDDTNGGRQFTDRVTVFGTTCQIDPNGSINIAASSILPAARSYTVSADGLSLMLAMASGAYSVRAISRATPTGHLNLTSI